MEHGILLCTLMPSYSPFGLTTNKVKVSIQKGVVYSLLVYFGTMITIIPHPPPPHHHHHHHHHHRHHHHASVLRRAAALMAFVMAPCLAGRWIEPGNPLLMMMILRMIANTMRVPIGNPCGLLAAPTALLNRKPGTSMGHLSLSISCLRYCSSVWQICLWLFQPIAPDQ